MTLSLVPVTDGEYDDWLAALEERFAVLLPAGQPGQLTPAGSRGALARALSGGMRTPDTDILWVVDDGRRVGHVWLTFSDEGCVVRDLRLDDPSVAHHVLVLTTAHATTAGATTLEAWATAGDASQQAFVAAGDFTTTSTKMALPFEGPQGVPETVALRPMTTAEFDSAQAADLEHYTAERARNGESEQVARQTAQEQTAQLLPDGIDTEGHRFWVGEADGRRVGTIWLDLRHEYAFVYNVAVDEPERGRGYGRALMRAGAAAAHQAGASGIGLNVFGDNVTARRLYDSLGYQPTQIGVRMLL